MNKPQKTEKKPAEKKKHTKVWAVDFDGTLHHGRYPNIGNPDEKLIAALQMAKLSGVKLILWTSREGNALDEAVVWCAEHGLSFDAVNDNVPEVIEAFGYSPRKIGANLFIDDQSFPWWSHGEKGDLCQLISKL